MSLNIKALTSEPSLPVKLHFSKIRSKLKRQQIPHIHTLIHTRRQKGLHTASHWNNVPTGQSNAKVWGLEFHLNLKGNAKEWDKLV